MQQTITWANVDQDLCRQMVSLGHNELRSFLSILCHHATTQYAYSMAILFLCWCISKTDIIKSMFILVIQYIIP